MSNSLSKKKPQPLKKEPSLIDTEVKCSLCPMKFYGPTGDMRSQRGIRFVQSLMRHISTTHPDTAQEIFRSTDPFLAYCTIRLFEGDENFEAALDEQQIELLNWLDPDDEDSDSPEPAIDIRARAKELVKRFGDWQREFFGGYFNEPADAYLEGLIVGALEEFAPQTPTAPEIDPVLPSETPN